MATGRITVERALLISTISDLNAEEIKGYEKDLKAWEKAQAEYAKKLASAQKKIFTAITKGKIGQFRVSSGYRWENGERVIYGSDLSIELIGVEPDTFGVIPDSPRNCPTDPRTMSHGKYYEREQMLKTLALTSKDEISLPINWSEQYL